MFETRFVIWGISRSILLLMGSFPLIFFTAFHSFSIELFVVGLLLNLFWIFFISKGLFSFTKVYFWSVLFGLTLELVIALRDKNFVQMLMGILCVLLFLTLFHWLEKIISRAPFNPGIKWYEGLPQFFPRIHVELFWKDQWQRASLRKLDEYGVFVFLQNSEQDAQSVKVNRSLKKILVPVKIKYRDLVFEGNAKIQSVFYDRWLGMGLQILPKDLYHFTQYSKIVQNLKGEGYGT